MDVQTAAVQHLLWPPIGRTDRIATRCSMVVLGTSILMSNTAVFNWRYRLPYDLNCVGGDVKPCTIQFNWRQNDEGLDDITYIHYLLTYLQPRLSMTSADLRPVVWRYPASTADVVTIVTTCCCNRMHLKRHM